MRFPFHTLFIVAIPGHLPSLLITAAVLQNITVDDTNGDQLTGTFVTYTPSSGWNIGNGCQTCAATPNSSFAWDATWQDATYYPGTDISPEREVQQARFSFTGSAIYVYGIQCHTLDFPQCTADIEFYIDGQLMPQTYTFTPDNPGTNTYTYNVLLYGNDALPTGPHSIVIQNGVQGVSSSIILLDYLVYTTDTDTDTPSTFPTPSPQQTTSSAAPTSPNTPIATSSTSDDIVTTSALLGTVTTSALSASTMALSQSTTGTTSPIFTNATGLSTADNAAATSSSSRTVALSVSTTLSTSLATFNATASSALTDSPSSSGSHHSRSKDALTIALAVAIPVVIAIIAALFIRRRRQRANLTRSNGGPNMSESRIDTIPRPFDPSLAQEDGQTRQHEQTRLDQLISRKALYTSDTPTIRANQENLAVSSFSMSYHESENVTMPPAYDTLSMSR
ncbi:hypothetical protein NM688_g5927 [Phlebia brevispora]|uniref:Uncharacterized protein n=1 Tax=Phlebia brevispora TaxID=194682 RepID=A0ACC1SMJ6_9APHY|nr:hypothetical protein NM688_g5927 [Phlebia brevispora]